jgi:antimicrobial peptide system SdpA family protein
MKHPRENSPLHLVATFVTCAGFWAAVLFYALQPALPYNPVRLPGQDEISTKILFPEGWAFFTKSPRDERPFVFVRTATGWTDASRAPIRRARNAFGLNRAVRAQNVELALLLNEQAVRKGWKACEFKAFGPCLDAAPAAMLRNTSPRPTLCGEVGVARQKPIPWAWARSESRESVVMPITAVRMRVEC